MYLIIILEEWLFQHLRDNPVSINMQMICNPPLALCSTAKIIWIFPRLFPILFSILLYTLFLIFQTTLKLLIKYKPLFQDLLFLSLFHSYSTAAPKFEFLHELIISQLIITVSQHFLWQALGLLNHFLL